MNDALSTSMFWVGALFAFTPIVVGGIVIGVWWLTRKRVAGSGERFSPPRGLSDDAPGSGPAAVER
ncbi:MAG: hypothetical protein OER21_08470 [Gemmatimonadota bacterium]|nr:hypothetical protein [Gemmatimonadota bacterium]